MPGTVLCAEDTSMNKIGTVPNLKEFTVESGRWFTPTIPATRKTEAEGLITKFEASLGNLARL